MSGERERLTVEQSLHDENIRLKLALADVEQALAEARAVVAAQREALRRYGHHIAPCPLWITSGSEESCSCGFAAALDAEGVSEPGERAGSHPHGAGRTEHHSPGSLTSPRWKCHTCGQWVVDAEGVSEPGRNDAEIATQRKRVAPDALPGSLTYPVDRAYACDPPVGWKEERAPLTSPVDPELDAEGVSEPGRVDQIATGKTTGAPASPGSLTSPVDTAPLAEGETLHLASCTLAPDHAGECWPA